LDEPKIPWSEPPRLQDDGSGLAGAPRKTVSTTGVATAAEGVDGSSSPACRRRLKTDPLAAAEI